LKRCLRLGSLGFLVLGSTGVALVVSTSEGMMGMGSGCCPGSSSLTGEPGLEPGLLLSSDSMGLSPERIRALLGSLEAWGEIIVSPCCRMKTVLLESETCCSMDLSRIRLSSLGTTSVLFSLLEAHVECGMPLGSLSLCGVLLGSPSPRRSHLATSCRVFLGSLSACGLLLGSLLLILF